MVQGVCFHYQKMYGVHLNICNRCNKLTPFSGGHGPHSAVNNVSDYRCVSDCRSRGCEFDPGPVPYFRGD